MGVVGNRKLVSCRLRAEEDLETAEWYGGSAAVGALGREELLDEALDNSTGDD